MQTIDETLLDQVAGQARKSPRLRMNHNFHYSTEDPVQRMLNAMEPGTVIPIHRHRETAESMILLRGRMKVTTYDDAGRVLESVVLDPREGRHGIHVESGAWHGVEVIESSVMFEVKEGSYHPISPDDQLETRR